LYTYQVACITVSFIILPQFMFILALEITKMKIIIKIIASQ